MTTYDLVRSGVWILAGAVILYALFKQRKTEKTHAERVHKIEERSDKSAKSIQDSIQNGFYQTELLKDILSELKSLRAATESQKDQRK
jgi:hypothetical protein